MNKSPLANETMGQKQTPPTLESLRDRVVSDRFAVSEFNGISLRRCIPRALSHRCIEDASGEQ